MSLTRWTELLNDVMPHVPGAAIDIVEHAIKRAVIEFCTKSLVLRATSDALTIEGGTGLVDLDSPIGTTQCVKALSAQIIGEPNQLDAKTPEWLDEWNSSWRTETGVSRYFTQNSPEQLIVALPPASTLTDSILVQMAVTPKLTAPGVEGWIFSRYAEQLASGAIGRLMAQPKKPWSNAALAGQHISAFRAGIGAAMASSAKGFGRAPLRTELCV